MKKKKGTELAKRSTDLPAIDTPQNRINIRKALAGLHLLNGEGSELRCLVKAGFSRSTARNLTQNGLSAERCIAEAAKLDSKANPANMLAAARARALLAIESHDPKTVPLKDSMKMLDTVEKYYGGHEIQPSASILSVAERLATIASLLAVAQARGLPVNAPARPFLEAKVLSEAVTSTEQRSVSTDGTTT